MACEAKVRQGEDPDAIHDIRVASRRLQQILDLVYPTPPRPVRRWRRTIRRCRRALSSVRNYDVMLQRTQRELKRKRSPRRDMWIALHDYLTLQRRESFAKAERKLKKIDFESLHAGLRHYLAGGQRPQAASPTVGLDNIMDGSAAEFHRRVVSALEKVWWAFVERLEESHRQRFTPAVHAARIATKRLRYLIEVIHEFDITGSQDVLTWLRAIQQHLGSWHDLEVLERTLLEMMSPPEFLAQHLDVAAQITRAVPALRKQKQLLLNRYLEMTQEKEELRRIEKWVNYMISSSAEILVAG